MNHILNDHKYNFKNKVAFITGAGRGIGKAVALQLAKYKASVVVTDLQAATAEETAQEISDLGGHSLGFGLDVGNEIAVKKVVEESIANFGGIDILFANAGILGATDIMKTTAKDWDEIYHVNIKGVVNSCQSVIPCMMKARKGRIIITASYNGFRSGVHVIPYRVTKASNIMYTRCLALALAPYKITVNALCPGVTATKTQLDYATTVAKKRKISVSEYLDDRAKAIPLQELTTTKDLQQLVSFLVSDDARLITGQAIGPDGGMMACS